MKKIGVFIGFFLFVILLSVPLVVATDITFINAYTNEEIQNVIVSVVSQEGKTTQFMTDSFTYDQQGKVLFLLDLADTPGYDYAVEAFVEETITVFPSATVKGLVKDKLDNVVGNADIKFECQNDNSLDLEFYSDDFGAFYREAVPHGNCRVFASYKNAVGITDITVEQGNVHTFDILLDKTIVTEERVFSWKVLVVFLGILILAFFIAHRNKHKPEIKVSKRREDIILTLSDKERDIVQFLLQNNNKANQSKIRYETGIPRTSLTRTMQSLEHKKIVELEKIGKLVKVKLTPWFLEENKDK